LEKYGEYMRRWQPESLLLPDFAKKFLFIVPGGAAAGSDCSEGIAGPLDYLRAGGPVLRDCQEGKRYDTMDE
jgi:hypothetical protein